MRLIDADKLIDYFYCGIDDKPIIDGISDRKIIDIIKSQPTTYSVGKVVEELKSLQTYNMGFVTLMSDLQRNGVYRHYVCLEDAIEIAKQGGVRKDVE